MNHVIKATLIAIGAVAACPPTLLAQARASQQTPAAGSSKIRACALVAKEEVKKHLPWISALDGMPVEEEPIGISGSSCNYPSVFIQVLPFSQGTIDVARKKGGIEALSGAGDEAYFHNNANQYAEIYVKAGKYLLTVQANVSGKVESVKPGALNLARALAAKLR